MTGSDPPAPFSGEQITAMVRSVSKLYVLAVLDEITTATVRYQADIAAIRNRYLTELGGQDPFALLLAVSQRPEWWRSGVSGVEQAGS